MSGDWRNNVGPDLPTIGLGNLSETDELVVQFQGEGEMRESQQEDWDDALSLQVTVMQAPEGYPAKKEGEEIEVEEGSDYYLMSASTRFMRAIMNYGDTLSGQIAVIESEGDGYSRQYYVTDASDK